MQTLTTKVKAPEEATAERRKTKRHRLGIRVSWRVLGERDSRYCAADLKDVGTDGLGLIVRRHCKCGTVVVVQLQGAPDAEPMLLRAEWAKEEPGNKWLV